jgi:transcriptional regulator with XRE-family HTH domain
MFNMNSTFSQRLKELRKEHGLTQDDLAKLSGVSFPTISRYENGQRDEPKLTILKTFANYFNVSIDYLVGDTNVKESDFTSDEIGRIFNQLDDDDKRILMDLAKTLLKKEGKV